MKKSFFPKSELQRESLLKKIAERNPSLIKSLNNTIGGRWDDKFIAWPESTFADIIIPPRN